MLDLKIFDILFVIFKCSLEQIILINLRAVFVIFFSSLNTEFSKKLKFYAKWFYTKKIIPLSRSMWDNYYLLFLWPKLVISKYPSNIFFYRTWKQSQSKEV